MVHFFLLFNSQDWKCIISMLLEENPSIELTEDDATNLIRLLFASVRKAVGERIVPASDNRKQYYNKAQKVCKSSSIYCIHLFFRQRLVWNKFFYRGFRQSNHVI